MGSNIPEGFDLRAGVYEHYKGRQYLVLGLGHDANHEDRVVVVYVPLYTIPGPGFAVRDLDDFLAWVHLDGTRCDPRNCAVTDSDSLKMTYEQTHRPRFRYLGATTPNPQEPSDG